MLDAEKVKDYRTIDEATIECGGRALNPYTVLQYSLALPEPPTMLYVTEGSSCSETLRHITLFTFLIAKLPGEIYEEFSSINVHSVII